MDILLVNPYISQTAKNNAFRGATMPNGLLFIAGYLRKHGIESKIIECGLFDSERTLRLGQRVRFGISDEEVISLVAAEKPRIVGISSVYTQYQRDTMEIAEVIKKAFPGVCIVMGGNHASAYWNYVLRNRSVDYIVYGEGEETFLELSRAILSGSDTGNIDGIGYRDKTGEPIRTNPRQLIKNLDDIPFLPLDMVDFMKYLGKGNQYCIRPPSAPILTSRGCPGSCVYCNNKAIWGRTWRGRSPKNVVDEIEAIAKKYGLGEFAFIDDSASVDKQRWLGICDEIIARKLDIKWTTPNGIAHWTLTREALKRMKEAGCYRVTFGIESGDVDTRKYLGKPYSLDQAKNLIQYANRIGMWTISTNIIGFPYERIESIQRTINFAKKSGTDFACFYLLVPFPKTDVYADFKREQLINLDDFFETAEFDQEKFEEINRVLNEMGSDTTVFTKEELAAFRRKAYQSFILYRALTYIFNPLRLIRKIHSVEDFRYLVKLVSKGIGVFLRAIDPRSRSSVEFLYKQTKSEEKEEARSQKSEVGSQP